MLYVSINAFYYVRVLMSACTAIVNFVLNMNSIVKFYTSNAFQIRVSSDI